MDWKVHYGDGKTFSDEDGSPEQAPALNVQAIAERNKKVGRRIISGFHFYVRREGRWEGVDWFGVVDHFITLGLLKAGRTVSDETFEQILINAQDDPDLPIKSSPHPTENGRNTYI